MEVRFGEYTIVPFGKGFWWFVQNVCLGYLFHYPQTIDTFILCFFYDLITVQLYSKRSGFPPV